VASLLGILLLQLVMIVGTSQRKMNDNNEIIKLSCDKCKKAKEGTYEELFGDMSNIRLLPKMTCKCGGNICLDMTGKYK
jgi:hypothetical protein